MLVELIAAVAHAGAAACSLRQEDAILLADRYIRIRDVIEAACIPPDVDENAIIAALPDGSIRVTLDYADIEVLVRRRAPKLADLASATAGRSLTFERPTVADEDGPSLQCFAASRDISAGELLTRNSVSAADCSAEPTASLAYDRKEAVVRAGAAIAQGAYLGRLIELPAAAWDANEALTMRLRVGAVVIERDVQAMESSAGDASIFVKDEDDQVFRTPVSALIRKEAGHD